MILEIIKTWQWAASSAYEHYYDNVNTFDISYITTKTEIPIIGHEHEGDPFTSL